MPVTAAHPIRPLHERRAPQTSSRTDRRGENPVRGGGFSKGGCKNFSSCLLDASSSEQTLARSPFLFPFLGAKKNRIRLLWLVGRARIKRVFGRWDSKRRTFLSVCFWFASERKFHQCSSPLLLRPGRSYFFCKKTNRFRPLLRRGDESLLHRLLLLFARLPF